MNVTIGICTEDGDTGTDVKQMESKIPDVKS